MSKRDWLFFMPVVVVCLPMSVAGVIKDNMTLVQTATIIGLIALVIGYVATAFPYNVGLQMKRKARENLAKLALASGKPLTEVFSESLLLYDFLVTKRCQGVKKVTLDLTGDKFKVVHESQDPLKVEDHDVSAEATTSSGAS